MTDASEGRSRKVEEFDHRASGLPTATRRDGPRHIQNSGPIEGFLPGEDMLVDAVDERAI
jgi:hypothetical protein